MKRIILFFTLLYGFGTVWADDFYSTQDLRVMDEVSRSNYIDKKRKQSISLHTKKRMRQILILLSEEMRESQKVWARSLRRWPLEKDYLDKLLRTL